jgi:hypothetical protein
MTVVIGELEVRPAAGAETGSGQAEGAAGPAGPDGLGPAEVTALADRAAHRREERRSRSEVY